MQELSGEQGKREAAVWKNGRATAGGQYFVMVCGWWLMEQSKKNTALIYESATS